MGLGVAQHLQAMLHFAVKPVVAGQQIGSVLRYPPLLGQSEQPGFRPAYPQIGIAPAGDDLPCLGEELDLADAPPSQLDVMTRQGQRPAQPLVRADSQPHVMGVLDGGEIEVPAPDERLSISRKRLPAAMSPAQGRAFM